MRLERMEQVAGDSGRMVGAFYGTHVPQKPEALGSLHLDASREISRLDDGIRAAIIRFHPHVAIDRRRESGESQTAHARGLRTRRPREPTAGEATCRDAVVHVVLRAEPLDHAFRAGEQRADVPEVLGRGIGRLAHVREAAAQLLAHRQLVDVRDAAGHAGAHGRVVPHAGHEQAEDAAEREAHRAGHDRLARAGFHHALHLSTFLTCSGSMPAARLPMPMPGNAMFDQVQEGSCEWRVKRGAYLKQVIAEM
nr:hypothetical protein CFP56_29860 [Quercus suber]